MNTTIINNYNAVIKEDDEVYFLGDVAWKDIKSAINVLRRLNVSKRYLLIGNHDHKNIKNSDFVRYFDWIKDYYELTYNSRLYVLSHYPFYSWRNSGRGSIMCAGHTHNRIDNSNYYRIDCGVDNPQCNFAPISIDKIEAIMKNKNIEPKH
jgi:calcineurin-like phosphoesterase family protein